MSRFFIIDVNCLRVLYKYKSTGFVMEEKQLRLES